MIAILDNLINTFLQRLVFPWLAKMPKGWVTAVGAILTAIAGAGVYYLDHTTTPALLPTTELHVYLDWFFSLLLYVAGTGCVVGGAAKLYNAPSPSQHAIIERLGEKT